MMSESIHRIEHLISYAFRYEYFLQCRAPGDVPMSAAVAARPRDERGYPVPAVTPWPDGRPEFARQSTPRTLVCMAERRCVVCGTKVPPGPVYRPVDGEAAELIAVALKLGKFYRNVAPSIEGAGHRSCMIYSAIVCPYLASPGARRKFDVKVGTEVVPRGDPRGFSAAVVGYDGYSCEVSAQGMEILYGQPVELLNYANGADLLAELRAEITQEQGTAEACPPYLLDDDAKAKRAAWTVLDGGASRAPAARQHDQVRKNRRKSARAARRKNR